MLGLVEDLNDLRVQVFTSFGWMNYFNIGRRKLLRLLVLPFLLIVSEAIQQSAINHTTHIYTMTKTHIKSFSTHGHMMQWWSDFKNDIIGCHEIGNEGEYIVKFSLKG